MTSRTSTQAYEEHTANIQKLLKSIKTGLAEQDKEVRANGINWANVGDLAHFEDILKEISDTVNRIGECAECAE